MLPGLEFFDFRHVLSHGRSLADRERFLHSMRYYAIAEHREFVTDLEECSQLTQTGEYMYMYF